MKAYNSNATAPSGLVLDKLYNYIRCGYDSRLISFCSKGIIARGRRRCEMFWEIAEIAGKSLLDILDTDRKLTCRLQLDSDGIWRGRWENGKKMPIELQLVPAKANAKALIIQHANDGCCEQLEVAFSRHSEYARLQGFDYWCLTGDIVPERQVGWTRILLLRRALRLGYDYMVWLDADTLIVDLNTDLREAGSEFNIIGMCRHPMSWGKHNWHYNDGVIFLKNNPQSRNVVLNVWNSGPSNHRWQEQDRLMAHWEKSPDSISPIDNRWNAQSRSSPSDKPVIRAWHNFGSSANRAKLMRDELKRLRKLDG
jgi:hypothetical protein